MMELKPCPFCGSAAVALMWYSPFDDEDGIELGRCSNTYCDARVPIGRWNQRDEPSAGAVVDLIAKYLEEEEAFIYDETDVGMIKNMATRIRDRFGNGGL